MSWYGKGDQGLEDMEKKLPKSSGNRFRDLRLKDKEYAIISFTSDEPEIIVLEHSVTLKQKKRDGTDYTMFAKKFWIVGEHNKCRWCEAEMEKEGKTYKSFGLYFNVYVHHLFQTNKDGEPQDIVQKYSKPEYHVRVLRLSKKAYNGLKNKLLNKTTGKYNKLSKYVWVYSRSGAEKEDTVYDFEKYTVGNDDNLSLVLSSDVIDPSTEEVIEENKYDFEKLLLPDDLKDNNMLSDEPEEKPKSKKPSLKLRR